jgi:hypothetical protein
MAEWKSDELLQLTVKTPEEGKWQEYHCNYSAQIYFLVVLTASTFHF